MSWKRVKLKEVLNQYRIEHIVQNDIDYKQVTISKHDGVCFRGYKNGKDIGRKRQFIVDLKTYPNTLMFVRQGVENGSIGIAPIEVDGCIATENMPMFTIDGIRTDFLKSVIKSGLFLDQVSKIPTTGSAQKSIHERQILEIEIPLPGDEEQLEIIENINHLNSINCEFELELTHQLSLVKQLRQAFLREAMQGKLLPQNPADEPASELLRKIKAEKEQLIKEKKLKKEKPLPPIKPEEIPFEIPENWVWCRLGEIALYSESGKSFKAIETPAKGNEIGVIKTSAITTGAFLEVENKLLPNQKIKIEKIKIENGDILFCRASGSKGLAGKSCIVKLTSNGLLVLSDKSIRYVFSQQISKSFIQDFNSSIFATNYYQKLGTGKSTSMNNITREQFNNLEIPLPPLSEQVRIVQKLEQLMQLCDGLEQSITQSQQQNEMLLQQVLREALEPKENVETV